MIIYKRNLGVAGRNNEGVCRLCQPATQAAPCAPPALQKGSLWGMVTHSLARV